MVINKLTFEQNLCAARVFLNTFGFVLEECSEINEFSKLKIFNKNHGEVGVLSFVDEQVFILVNDNNVILNANYGVPKIFGFADTECSKVPYALFRQWSSKIDFVFDNMNGIKLSGEFLITSSIDTEYGLSCFCHPLINIETSDGKKITLKMSRNGLMFGLEVKSDEAIEKIEIRPKDEINGFFLHDLRCGYNTEDEYSYLFRKYSGVFNGAEVGEDVDKLHVFLQEEEGEKTLDFYSDFILKDRNENFDNVIIQIGELMKKLDPSAFERIKELKSVLLFGGNSLLDNLVGVCYDAYSDDEIFALLDFKREKMDYQNGADDLVTSYFGTGTEGCLFLFEEQKRLIKE